MLAFDHAAFLNFSVFLVLVARQREIAGRAQADTLAVDDLFGNRDLVRLGVDIEEAVASGDFGRMVASHPPEIVAVPLKDVVGRVKVVPPDLDVVRTARAVGISFGD